MRDMDFQNENSVCSFFENENSIFITLKMKIVLDIAIFENENRVCSFDSRKLRKCILKVLKRMRKVKS